MVSNGIILDEFGYQQVYPKDYFDHTCSCCGDCCRNIKDSVMVEPLDMYRLAKFFQMEMGEVAIQYTDTTLLSWGFPVLMLKTRQYLDSCIFLQSSRCSVQSAKLRTCRLFPLSVGPDDKHPVSWLSFIVSKNQCCLTGQGRLVGDWISENFTIEDREFVTIDYVNTGELAKLMKQIKRQYEDEIIRLSLFYRYIFFEMSEEFMPQYYRNMELLKQQLAALI